jgi:hypothetical protein
MIAEGPGDLATRGGVDRARTHGAEVGALFSSN